MQVDKRYKVPGIALRSVSTIAVCVTIAVLSCVTAHAQVLTSQVLTSQVLTSDALTSEVSSVNEQAEHARQTPAQIDSNDTFESDSVLAESAMRRTPTRRWDWLSMEVGGSYDNLTSDLKHSDGSKVQYKDWGSAYLDVSRPFGDRKTVYASLRYLNQFGISDGMLFAGLYHPLFDRATIVVEGVKGFAHRITPVWSLFGQFQYNLGMGLGLWAGFRNSQYTNDMVQIFNGTAEYWFSNYRAALTVYESRGSGGLWKPPSYVGQFDYYYGANVSSIGILAAAGHEYDKIPTAEGEDRLLSYDTKTINLIGRHWFVPKWALSYQLGWHEQSRDINNDPIKFYDKFGLRLGVRHRFGQDR